MLDLELLLNNVKTLDQFRFDASNQSVREVCAYEWSLTKKKVKIFVVPRAKDLNFWHEFFGEFHHDVLVFPYFSLWGGDRYVQHTHASLLRQEVLTRLSLGNETLILTTLTGLLQKIPPLSLFQHSLLHLNKGQDYNSEDLIKQLEELGFFQTTVVQDKGTYSLKGGIVDCFPLNLNFPLRLEFFADELSSMKFFSLSDQKTFESIERITIPPVNQLRVENPQSVYDKLLQYDVPQYERNRVMEAISQKNWAGLEMYQPFFYEKTSCLLDEIQQQASFFFLEGLGVSTTAHQKLVERWNLARTQEQGSGSLPIDVHFENLNQDPVCIECFVDPNATLEDNSFNAWTFLNRKSPKKLPKKPSNKQALRSADLNVGDYVVHADHGVGRYLGIKHYSIEGVGADFVVIEYQNQDKIYLNISSLQKIQKYQPGDMPTRVDKLGGDQWKQKKAKVQNALFDLAQELLETHAKRNIHSITPLIFSQELLKEFVQDFPYEETTDQAVAIQDIAIDLTKPHPMERLVIGDVGFGKTEVAMRATMQCVSGNFQVAVLVPTTILSYQHSQTFKQRFEKFGVSVMELNRFVPAKKQKEILENFQSGKLDILIGTHRLLSKDIKPKNLGLIIIDEEHRFGVSQKEKLKNIKPDAHILSLSATPIPRTLHMATIGLRDISILATPPANRLPVRTIVESFSWDMIVNAIRFEIKRGGQVFYVQNRIEELPKVSHKISQLLPEVKVKSAHGQDEEMSSVIMEFLEQKFQVLVCTTIIESGVDMPNVNTLIVDSAENFGLSQLHQLRGRVGRSLTQGYAYLLTTAKVLSQDAQKRLDVLKTYQDLGAGFHLAQHDMEIRGVGNLLGAEQSGNIATVGLDYYLQMLEEVILLQKSGGTLEDLPQYDLEIQILGPALIPSSYVHHEVERMRIYRQIAHAKSSDELASISEATRDQYGDPPREVLTLFDLAKIKLLLYPLGVKKITQLSATRFLLKPHQHVFQTERQFEKWSQLTGFFNKDGVLEINIPESGFLEKSLESFLNHLQYCFKLSSDQTTKNRGLGLAQVIPFKGKKT